MAPKLNASRPSTSGIDQAFSEFLQPLPVWSRHLLVRLKCGRLQPVTKGQVTGCSISKGFGLHSYFVIRQLAATPTLLAAFLNRRARVRAIGAIHAAVTRQRFEHGVAVSAFVKPLTGIRGHRLARGKATLRTRQRGLQRDGLQFAVPTTVDG